jgi:hypothetical protein
MSVEAALSARGDLDAYRAGRRSLYALQLAFRLDDIHTVAASALTDGPDDKSCDVVFVDRDAGRIVLIQGYEATNPVSSEAPQSKAATLHQAAAWLFSQDEQDLPERLRSAAREVDEALTDGAIQQVDIWFVHNLPESVNVEREMDAVAAAARRMIEHRHAGIALDSVMGVEVGRATLASWYEGSQTPILVTDQLELRVAGAFEETGDNWSAVCTSVDTEWLHDLIERFGDRIFSANVRGYLGSTRSSKNINNGIKDTAQRQSGKLWAFNNGITALVHSYELTSPSDVLRLSGIAIVNGAQTTGAIGSLARESVAGGRVLARFIRCGDIETVRSIIRFNNRQNPTETADFRSNDRVQIRLVREFAELGIVGYTGGRRGGVEDVIRRPAENQIPATVAAQALAAFHRDPGVAYHEKGKIWEDHVLYDRFFSDATSAQHIVFCYGLLKAIEQARQELLAKPVEDRTTSEARLASFFRQRGSHLLQVAALGECVEALLDRQVPDPFRLAFRRGTSLPQAISAWRSVLTPGLALAPQTLSPMLEREGSLRQPDAVNEALGNFLALFEATKTSNESIYRAFADLVEVN